MRLSVPTLVSRCGGDAFILVLAQRMVAVQTVIEDIVGEPCSLASLFESAPLDEAAAALQRHAARRDRDSRGLG